MRKFCRLVFALTACALVSGCATHEAAPPPPTPAQLLADASAGDFTCSRASAMDVTFDRFATAAQAYADKCIRIKALATFRYLYKDGGAIPAQKSVSVAPSTIGVYWKDDGAMRKLDAGAQFVEIVGRVRDCGARNKLMQAASIAPTVPCQGVTTAIFVSQTHIFPTAMD